MTDKDYEELKARLLAEGLLIKTSKAKQHEYFRKFNDYMTDLHKSGSIKTLSGYGPIDSAIKNALRWVYNAKTINRMPDDCRDEANDLAIKIIDMLLPIHDREMKK